MTVAAQLASAMSALLINWEEQNRSKDREGAVHTRTRHLQPAT